MRRERDGGPGKGTVVTGTARKREGGCADDLCERGRGRVSGSEHDREKRLREALREGKCG
jgi:hypothetical protein